MAIVSPRVKTLSGKQCSVSGNCQHSCVKGHSLSLKTKPQQYTCVSSVPLLRISPAKTGDHSAFVSVTAPAEAKTYRYFLCVRQVRAKTPGPPAGDAADGGDISSSMASAWSVGILFVLQVILVSAVAPEDCSSLPLLHVSYEETILDSCGTEGPKSLYKLVNSVRYEDVEAGQTYAVVMVDPDAPNHNAGEAWLHWILSNVEASDLQSGNIGNGKEVVAYRPPTPPSGTHRYFFYLYKESQKQLPKVDRRGKFVLQTYVDVNGLVGPIAMNMFKTSK
ncbi:phosphatidylethanolamine-binding protein 4 isoform X2 [Penaeus vannamei]|uniref:phosphatidylethanolamine-binding protein 4 isoform X2 n=1 Tax=Penaeus vannamei TaxID=6689 RepID=UPI00387F5085